MRILAVADVESRYYYDYYTPGRLDGFDLILSCGDLGRSYLEFLVTMARCPVLYVPGNHDDRFETDPPEGCECIDGRVAVYGGLRIMGLGGAYRYRPGTYMYSEREMQRRILKTWPAIRRSGGIDILVTHAPARGLNDGEDLAHRGFQCFNTLLDRYRPRYFIHGHIHKNYGVNVPRQTERDGTTVVNAWEHCILEY